MGTARRALLVTSASRSAPWTARARGDSSHLGRLPPTCVPISGGRTGTEGRRPQWVSPSSAQQRSSRPPNVPIPHPVRMPAWPGWRDGSWSSRRAPHPQREPGEAGNQPLPQSQVAGGCRRPGLSPRECLVPGDPEVSWSSGSSAFHAAGKGGGLGVPLPAGLTPDPCPGPSSITNPIVLGHGSGVPCPRLDSPAAQEASISPNQPTCLTSESSQRVSSRENILMQTSGRCAPHLR